MKGWVYVITNKAMPGLVKVGYTMKDPELRAAELNHTGSPHPYVVDYELLVEEPRDIERDTHSRLRSFREGKEWFRCSSEEAIAAIKALVGPPPLVENFKRADRERAEDIERQRRAEEKLKEQQQERETQLNQRRQEIFARYEPLLERLLSGMSYFEYFFGVFIILIIIFLLASVVLLNEIHQAVFWFSLFGSFVLTPLGRNRAREKVKASSEYKAILAKRDAELSVIENTDTKAAAPWR